MIPTQIKPQLAVNESISPDELTSFEGKYMAQEKLDGTRIVVIRKDGETHLMSRSWKNDFTKAYPDIAADMSQLPDDTILDGELVMVKDGQVKFISACAKDGKAGSVPKLMLFDVIRYGGENMMNNTQFGRSQFLLEMVDRHDFKHTDVIPTVMHDFKQLFEKVIAAGGEGIMLKERLAGYKCNSRTKAWRKVKREETHDCFVLGMAEGTGGNVERFGSLVVGQFINGKMQIVAKCSGFETEMRETLYHEIMAMPEQLKPDEAMWKGYHLHLVRRVEPTMVIEVKCMERFPDTKIMRHPVFIRVRDDKSVEQCIA
jgi:bifunctional non-homologous end joining protein LigD